MKKIISSLLTLALFVGSFVFVPGYSVNAAELLSSIVVDTDFWELQPGVTTQLVVNLINDSGEAFSGTADMVYISMNPYVASVDANGLVTAHNIGVTKVIVKAQGVSNLVSRTVSISVAEPSDKVTFENMKTGIAPVGMKSSELATVTDTRAKDSTRSVYINDSSITLTASMHYGTSASSNLTLDFDVYSENGNVALKIFNGTNSNSNTAFWLRFTSTETNYYTSTGYVKIGSKALPKGKWSSVHIEITNTNLTTGNAIIYIDGELVGTALKTVRTGYGANTATVIDSVYFMSSGGADKNDRFNIDNLKLVTGITPLPAPATPKLSIDLGGIFDIASNSEPILKDSGEAFTEDYILEDYADGFGFCQIPFIFAPTSMDKVYVNYSRHRDVVMDDPIDSIKIFDPSTLLSAKANDSVSSLYTSMKTDHDLFLMSMAELPDGRLFAQNYINYYINNTTARTSSSIVNTDGTWTKVTGTLTLEGFDVTGEIGGSNWFPIVFSKGIEILPDGTILHTMYGLNKALLVQSNDLGLTWTLRSVIAENDGTHFNTDGSIINYYEPSLQRCKDGSLLSIIRTDSNKPLYQSRSLDNGLTWSNPILLPGVSPMEATSIYPQTTLLENGVLALATGRPNNKVLFSLDGSGYRWGYSTTIMVPATSVKTTGNTSLTKIAPNTLLVVGDRGFIQNEAAGIWGRTVRLTRNLVTDPVLDSAILRSEKDKLTLGSTLQIGIEGIFDGNSDLIPLSECEVVYYSESPELASVDADGTVSAIKEGTVRITASVSHSGRIVLTNSVDILLIDAEKLYSVSTSIDKWFLSKGESAQIYALALNQLGAEINGTFWNFTSSDTSVLSVNSTGRVEAKGIGVAQIEITAIKGSVVVTRKMTVIVDSKSWTLEDFESGALGTPLPTGFSSTIGSSISDSQAASPSKSLYIRDDITTGAINVTRNFTPAKGVVVEFMLYPELVDHSLTIGLGSTGTAIANETCLLGFAIPPIGSDILRVQAYNGSTWSFVNQVSGVRLKTWNKIRIEATVDKPARLYVNGQFIAELPIVAAQLNINRIRFTTGGTAYVNDYYHIDDFKVMTTDTSSDFTGICIADETIDGKNNGAITGVTTAMEWKTEGGSYANVTDVQEKNGITGLTPGRYFIRYATGYDPLTDAVYATEIVKGSPSSYQVNLNLNGGILSSPIEQYNVGIGAMLPMTPIKEGYDFMGWYDNNEFIGSAVTAISGTASGDKSFWAKWCPKNHDVANNLVHLISTAPSFATFSLDYIATLSASAKYVLPGSITIKIGSTVLLSGVDYTYDSSSGVITIHGEKITDRVSISASGIPKEYPITFHLNDGLMSGAPASYSFGKSILLPFPEKSGHRFIGWYDNESFDGSAVAKIDSTDIGNKEYWAKWRKIVDPATDNLIENIAPGSVFTQGEDITFICIGGGMDNNNPVNGELRYVPSSWNVNPNGSWTSAPYRATFRIDVPGNYTLTTTYLEEIYDSNAWRSTGKSTIKTIDFIVKEKTVSETPVSTSDGSETDNASSKNPIPVIPLVVIALILVVSISIFLGRKKIFKK